MIALFGPEDGNNAASYDPARARTLCDCTHSLADDERSAFTDAGAPRVSPFFPSKTQPSATGQIAQVALSPEFQDEGHTQKHPATGTFV